jgi:hypothetical protein
VRPRIPALVAGVLVAAGVGVGVAAYASGASSDGGGVPPKVEASIADWRWAPKEELPGRAEPVEKPAPKPRKPKRDPAPQRPASVPASDSAEDPAVPDELPPIPKAPDADSELGKAEAIRAIIQAGNVIARHPYKWGGGHGKWQDNGYDCSGSVSYALAAAGLLDSPLASGPLMSWGKPGKGKWLTIYSNPGHVYMVVAGVRFDTSAARRGTTGSRFTNELRETSGYAVRHWPGL